MATLADRLKAAFAVRGISSNAAFAREVGVERATVGDWLSGRTKKIYGDRLMRVDRALSVTPEWLLTGSPSEIAWLSPAPGQPGTGGASVLAVHHKCPPGEGKYVSIPHQEVKILDSDGVTACWIDPSAGDIPLILPEEWFAARGYQPADCRALRMHDPSMMPSIEDGDTVCLNTQLRNIKDGAVYGVVYYGDLFVRRLFRVPRGGIELRADNAATYPPVVVADGDLDHLIVLGRMIYRGG